MTVFSIFQALSHGFLLFVVPGGVLLGGGWFLVRTKAFFLRHPKKCFGALFKKAGPDGVSPLKALTLALAGTLGVGNLAGVASAIVLGGPGALFWMLLSSVAAMLLKYAETVLALLHRKSEADGFHGGAMYYMPKKCGKVFALLCLFCSFTVGNSMQTAAVASSFRAVTGGGTFHSLVIGGVLALLLLAVLWGGKKGAEGGAAGKKDGSVSRRRLSSGRIFDFAVFLVPFMTAAYLLLCGILLFRFRAALPGAMRQVFLCAFTGRAAISGVAGYSVASALRQGVIRGLISNEAGCGTAPIAHSGAETVSPASQGCLGILEVTVDTVLLCTITALAVLVVGAPRGTTDGMEIVLAVFRTAFGEGAGWLLFFAVFLFAFATMVSWSFYGKECLHFFAPDDRFSRGYFLLFSLFCIPAALLPGEGIWAASDLTVGIMTVLNLGFLLLRRKEVLRETQRFLLEK